MGRKKNLVGVSLQNESSKASSVSKTVSNASNVRNSGASSSPEREKRIKKSETDGDSKDDGESSSSSSESRYRDAALAVILNAWEEATSEGVPVEMLASTSIFAAFSNMVNFYGEEAAAQIASGLAERVRRGDFTVYRTIH